MIKRKVENQLYLDNRDTIPEDSLTPFIFGEGNLRGVFCSATKMINEMRANHQLQLAETLILGQNYIAASLLSSNLKENDIIRLKVNCTGPLGGLNVEADYRHRVRGYLTNNPVDSSAIGLGSLSELYGAGILSVTRTNRLTNKPFTGQIELQEGNTAKDLAYYFTVSEQNATSFSLDITFYDDGNVQGAGGLLVQALPGAKEKDLIEAEKIILGLPSIGKELAKGTDPTEFITKHFAALNPKILTSSKTGFFCNCTREQIEVHISALSRSDKEDIINKNDFPIKTLCHNCGTSYVFSREESMELMLKQKNIQ